VAAPTASPPTAGPLASGSQGGAPLPGALLALFAVSAVVAGASLVALRHGRLTIRRRPAAPLAAAAPAIDPEAWARLVAEVEALSDNDPEPPATLRA
jgi:hypothetical protein